MNLPDLPDLYPFKVTYVSRGQTLSREILATDRGEARKELVRLKPHAVVTQVKRVQSNPRRTER